MRDAVIVAALRTPVGRRGGVLADVHPVDLGATVLRALAERTQIDPSLVEDVIWGCVTQAGEQAMNVGRNTVLAAGWPEGVPATTVDRQCGSSQQAVHFAAAGLVAGHYDLVVAGGVESMTREPLRSAMTEGTFGGAVLARYADALAAQGADTSTRASAQRTSQPVGSCRAPSWTSSPSARTSGPRPRPTAAPSTRSWPRSPARTAPR